MNNVHLYFSVDKQNLHIETVYKLVEKTINYVEAHFDLSSDWEEFELIEAVWSGGGHDIVTPMLHDSVIVPFEVLQKPGVVKVNLVGCDISEETVEKRLTTKQIPCLQVKSTALVNGENSGKPTPTDFEQFVAEVEDDAERAEEAANRAETAKEIIVGDMEFYIDEHGHLQFSWETNLPVRFYLKDGHLYLEEDY